MFASRAPERTDQNYGPNLNLERLAGEDQSGRGKGQMRREHENVCPMKVCAKAG